MLSATPEVAEFSATLANLRSTAFGQSMTRRTLALLAAGLCALVVAAPATAGPRRLPPLTPAGPDALTRALARGELSEASYALERARTLFDLRGVRREFGDVERPSPHSATPILRDLVARYRSLSSAERETAGRILGRPTNNSDPDEHQYRPNAIVATACDGTRPLCFHWDERAANDDAPPGADGNPATVPTAVQDTIDTFGDVYDLEVTAYGYLAPLPDSTSAPDNGGNGNTDIYLADLGGDPVQLFGYCTTDDPNAFDPGYAYYDISAYCVVDDDFTDFGPPGTAQAFRDVTSAHEFFHAIQFHYDWFEDLWLMEGTAMLMEDQYADDVNDNLNYLDNSVLRFPSVPVDLGSGGFEYGAWIWWRFLVEELGQLSNPLVIRQVWERVAAASTDTDGTGPDNTTDDLYSLRGTTKVARANGYSFPDLYARFAWANRIPSNFYEEGATYPRATVRKTYRLGRRGASTGWQPVRLRHLASTYTRFVPRSTTPANAVLRVAVHLPDLVHSPRAFLLVKAIGKPWSVRRIGLDTAGDGARKVGFGRGAIREVDLVLTNASPQMHCGRNTSYSCNGVGADDLRMYAYRAEVR
jgi:hypothetical protein